MFRDSGLEKLSWAGLGLQLASPGLHPWGRGRRVKRLLPIGMPGESCRTWAPGCHSSLLSPTVTVCAGLYFREATREKEAERGCVVEATRVTVGQEQNCELTGDCRPACSSPSCLAHFSSDLGMHNGKRPNSDCWDLKFILQSSRAAVCEQSPAYAAPDVQLSPFSQLSI